MNSRTGKKIARLDSLVLNPDVNMKFQCLIPVIVDVIQRFDEISQSAPFTSLHAPYSYPTFTIEALSSVSESGLAYFTRSGARGPRAPDPGIFVILGPVSHLSSSNRLS